MMVRPSQFEIQSEQERQSGRLIVGGELDLATVAQAEDAVRALLARDVRDLIIDLSRLSFIEDPRCP